MDIRVTLTPVKVIQPLDIRGTHRQAMGIQAIRVVLVTPALPPMGTKAIRSTPDRPAASTRGTPVRPVDQVTDIEAVPLNRGSAWLLVSGFSERRGQLEKRSRGRHMGDASVKKARREDRLLCRASTADHKLL